MDAASRHPLPIAVGRMQKSYGPVVALDDVSLDIAAGDFVTLLGPSGSGKTTLLMVMAGFVRPDAGSLAFGGRQVLMLPPHERGVGMVFQNYALFPHMTVLDNVAFPLKVRGVARAEARRRAEAALALVDREAAGARRVHPLRGGRRRRGPLARAGASAPPILLMDEPLSALDKSLRERMQIEIRRLHERLGMTTVYVTHDQREALTMSDRIAVLNRGRIEQYATPSEIYERPASAFVADFIGESSLLPVRVEGLAATLGRQRLDLPRAPQPAPGHLLVLRPEKLELLPPGSDAPPGANRIAGTVQDRIFQGESVLYFIVLPEGPSFTYRLQVRAGLAGRLPEKGAAVVFALDRQDTLVVPQGGVAA